MAKPGDVGAAGGIIGATAAGLETLVINCSNYGKVSTTSTFGGGIIGLLRVVNGNTNYKVSGCYNYGDISGSVQVGGIVGGSRDRIENSYTLSTAKINGSAAVDLILDGEAAAYIGAIVGRLETTAAMRTAGGFCDADGNPITVKITAVLYTDGGTLPEGVTSPAEIIAETAVLGQLPVPVKESYRFVRWELKVVSGEGDDQTISYVAVTESTVFQGPAHTVELVARYVEQVTITVNADGGEYDGETTITLDKGGKLDADALGVPTKEGYTFLGWFNGDTRVAADDVYEADVEIKAHWEKQAQKSNIKFNSDGALVDSKELTVGEEIGTLPVPPAKAGYRFDGWYDVDDNKITETSTFEASVVDLNAKWVLQTVITFTAEGGTINGEATKSIDAGTAIGTLPTATIDVAGEAFGGWLTADGKLVDENTVFAADVTAITLTASFGWDGETVSESLSGEGTEEAPYLISSGADLAYLASSVNGGNNYSGKYISLTKNVNMNFKAWTSIGKTSDKVFSGIFDGKNFAIENVTDAFIEYAAGATVKNLTLSVKIQKTTIVGGLISITKDTACTVENVTVKGSVSGSEANVAGVVGKAQGATTIRNCKNYADITSTLGSGLAFAGGILGSSASTIVIDSCENYGTITAKGTMVGGIAGLPRKAANSYVTGCKNFGNVTGSAQVGGIVGASRVKVQNSYCLETALINGKEAKTLTLYGIKTSVGGSVLTASVVGQIDDKAGNSDCGELVNCGLCNANGEAITDEQQ